MHDWPGNVRELRNAIERAMILENTSYIQPASLHVGLRARQSALGMAAVANLGSSPGAGISLREQERRLIVQALERVGGNQSHAARLLKISRDALRYKMKKFHLHNESINQLKKGA